MPKPKYTFYPPSTYTRYIVDFGRNKRSFPTEQEARDYLDTPEALEFNTDGYWLIKETRVILVKVNKGSQN